MIKTEFEELWKGLSRDFNWNKVYKVIIALEWSWYESKTGMNHIPTRDVIFEKAKELCKQAYDKECEVGTGGLYAKYEHDNLSLRFEIESNTYPIF